MVEQFGFAIILSSFVNASALISGTTNFLVGSILQADELSTTVMPASANFGAHSKEVEPPAENKAKSGFFSIAVCGVTTVYSFPLKLNFLPAERSEATGINSVTGKFLYVRTFNISLPTKPVEPPTATFILIYLMFKN